MKAGWEERTLGELALVVAGQSPKGDTYNNDGAGVPFHQGKKAFGRRGISAATVWTTEPSKMANQGDILMSVRAPVGPVNFATEDCCVGRGLAAIRAKNQIDPEFLFYLLQCKQSEITGNAGAVFSSINKKSIGEIRIPLPPLAEQKQIVSVLDQAFAGIERAAEAARKNRDNARELFEITLNATFTQKGEGWVETTLGEVCEFKNGLNFTKSSKGQEIKIVGVRDFQSNFEIPLERLETAQIDGELSEAYEMKAGDILTVRSNGNKQLIGRCMLAPPISETTSHSGFTIRIRVTDQRLSPTYLTHYLKSGPVHNSLISSGEGANISSLNQKALSSLPAYFPDQDRQKKIVSQIEEVSAQTQRLEALYQQKLDALDELKQSLLQKAFAGELTANFMAGEADALGAQLNS